MKRGLPPIPKSYDENGKRPCRGCGGPVPKGFRTWCGKECREKHYMSLSGWARARLKERDHGVCALCGADAGKVERILRWLRWHRGDEDARHAYGLLATAWNKAPLWRWGLGHTWEADHIVPLSEGGTSTMDNYRTLCIPCHKDATRLLRRRLARGSRQEAMIL